MQKLNTLNEVSEDKIKWDNEEFTNDTNFILNIQENINIVH